MKNGTGVTRNTGLLVLAFLLTLFVIGTIWTASQIAEIQTEMESSVDALRIVVATAQQSIDNARALTTSLPNARADARANAHATATALRTELDGLRATATAHALAPTPTPAPVWPISVEQCDSYDPPDRAEYIIESEIDFLILSYDHLLSAITLTSCAQNYGDPYFEWLAYYIVHGLEGLDFGLSAIDPEWRLYWLEQLPVSKTDQG